MNFAKLVASILQEQNVSGGASSAYGPGVVSTATSQSGDHYAPEDTRVAKSLYGSTVISRFGSSGGSTKSRKKRNKKRKQWT